MEKKEEDDLGNNKSLRLLRVHIWCSASEPLEVQRDCLQEQIDFLSSFFFFLFTHAEETRVQSFVWFIIYSAAVGDFLSSKTERDSERPAAHGSLNSV